MRRILAIRHDNNGDVTLLGPALRALATRGAVRLVCSPTGEGAARLLPDVAEVVVMRAEWIDANPRPIERASIEAAIATYAALAADEAFVFTSFHQSPLPTALLLRLAGVTQIAAVSVDYPGALLDTRVQVSDDLHEVERALALVGARGYRLPAGDDATLRYGPLPPRFAGLPPHYVALQAGATVPARAWDPLRLREVVARLEAAGRRVVIVGSAAERELVRTVAGRSEAIELAGRTTYAQFVAVVRDADALVVGNSAGIHIAGAVGTPVVTIFPPTIAPGRFAPWHVPFEMLGDHTIACAGCRARVCPLPGQPCIGGVEPGAVLAALERLAPHAPSRLEVPV